MSAEVTHEPLVGSHNAPSNQENPVARRDEQNTGAPTAVIQALRRTNDHFSGVTLPCVTSATYSFESTADLSAYQDEHRRGVSHRDEYGRYGNYTVRECEKALSKLDNAEATALFSAGMKPIEAVFHSLLESGSHVILGSDCYRQTREVIRQDFAKFGVSYSSVDTNDFERLAEAITPKTRCIFYESPTNPYLRVIDLQRLTELVNEANRSREVPVRTVIDSTFATPINQLPLLFGVDFVVHSATKYLGGHNDLMAGTVSGQAEILNPIFNRRGRLGDMPSPEVAQKLYSHLSTFALRVVHQNSSALTVARYLEAHPKVARVWYPGLPSHPDYEVARAQFQGLAGPKAGFGGVVSFELCTDYAGTQRFIDRCTRSTIAPSLGGPLSLIEQPAHISYSSYTAEERAGFGIKDNLVRWSSGLEGVEDIIEDFEHALRGI